MASCFVKVNIDSPQQVSSACAVGTVDSSAAARQSSSDSIVEQSSGLSDAEPDGHPYSRLGISDGARSALQDHLAPRALQPGWHHVRVKDGKLHVERAARVTQVALTTLSREVQNKSVLVKEVLNSRCRGAAVGSRSIAGCCAMLAACANHDAKKGKRFGLLGVHGSYHTAAECLNMSHASTPVLPTHICRWSTVWGSQALVLQSGLGAQAPACPPVLRCIGQQLENKAASLPAPDCCPNVELEYVLHVSSEREFTPHVVLKACKNLRLPDSELMADLGEQPSEDACGSCQALSQPPCGSCKTLCHESEQSASTATAQDIAHALGNAGEQGDNPSQGDRLTGTARPNGDAAKPADHPSPRDRLTTHSDEHGMQRIPDGNGATGRQQCDAPCSSHRQDAGCSAPAVMSENMSENEGSVSVGASDCMQAQRGAASGQRGPDAAEGQNAQHVPRSDSSPSAGNVRHAGGVHAGDGITVGGDAREVGRSAQGGAESARRSIRSGYTAPTITLTHTFAEAQTHDNCDTPRPVAPHGSDTPERVSQEAPLLPSKRSADVDAAAVHKRSPKRTCLEGLQQGSHDGHGTHMAAGIDARGTADENGNRSSNTAPTVGRQSFTPAGVVGNSVSATANHVGTTTDGVSATANGAGTTTGGAGTMTVGAGTATGGVGTAGDGVGTVTDSVGTGATGVGTVTDSVSAAGTGAGAPADAGGGASGVGVAGNGRDLAAAHSYKSSASASSIDDGVDAALQALLHAAEQNLRQHTRNSPTLHHSTVVSSSGMSTAHMPQHQERERDFTSTSAPAQHQDRDKLAAHGNTTDKGKSVDKGTSADGAGASDESAATANGTNSEGLNLTNGANAQAASCSCHPPGSPQTRASQQQQQCTQQGSNVSEQASVKIQQGSTVSEQASVKTPGASAMPPPPNRTPPTPRAAPDIPLGALLLGRAGTSSLRHSTWRHECDKQGSGEGSPLPSQVPVQLLRLANSNLSANSNSSPSGPQSPSLSAGTSLLPVSPSLKKHTSASWTLGSSSGMTITTVHGQSESNGSANGQQGTEDGSKGSSQRSAAQSDADKQQQQQRRLTAAWRSKQQQAQQHMAMLMQMTPALSGGHRSHSIKPLSPSTTREGASNTSTSSPQSDQGSNPSTGNTNSTPTPGAGGPRHSTVSGSHSAVDPSNTNADSAQPEQPVAKRRRRSSVLHPASASEQVQKDKSSDANGSAPHGQSASTSSRGHVDTGVSGSLLGEGTSSQAQQQVPAFGMRPGSGSLADLGSLARQGGQSQHIHTRLCLQEGATLLEPDQLMAAKAKAHALRNGVGADGSRPEGGVWAGTPSAHADSARPDIAICRDWRLFKVKYDKLKRELVEYKQKCEALQHRNIHLETVALALKEVQNEYHKLRTHYLYWKEMSDKMSEKSKQLEAEVSRLEGKHRQDVVERDFWQQRWEQANIEAEGLRRSLQEAQHESATLARTVSELRAANDVLRKPQPRSDSTPAPPSSDPEHHTHTPDNPVNSRGPVGRVKDECMDDQQHEEVVANSGEGREQEEVVAYTSTAWDDRTASGTQQQTSEGLLPDATQQLKMSRIQVADLEEEVQFLRRQLEEKNKKLASLLS